MRKINHIIDIAASVDRVFDFATRPNNLPGIWPSLVEVSNVERREDGWHAFDWTYKMLGVRFHGNARTVRIEPNAYVEVLNAGGIPSTFRWKYEPHEGGTRVSLDVEYTIPAPVLGKIAEAIAAKANEHEMLEMLANLKTALEVAPQVKAKEGAAAHP